MDISEQRYGAHQARCDSHAIHGRLIMGRRRCIVHSTTRTCHVALMLVNTTPRGDILLAKSLAAGRIRYCAAYEDNYQMQHDKGTGCARHRVPSFL